QREGARFLPDLARERQAAAGPAEEPDAEEQCGPPLPRAKLEANFVLRLRDGGLHDSRPGRRCSLRRHDGFLTRPTMRISTINIRTLCRQRSLRCERMFRGPERPRIHSIGGSATLAVSR